MASLTMDSKVYLIKNDEIMGEGSHGPMHA